MKEKILVVDDDAGICEILEFNLKSEGFDVISSNSAEAALQILDSSFSLILLDVMMGGISGYKMAEQLRSEKRNIPIIFLTARDTENDMLTGFSVGGDDYISKPFSVKEVIARVKAVIQRSATKNTDESHMEIDDLKINFATKEVRIAGALLVLTKTEYSIFELLIKSPNRLFSRDEILAKVWGTSVYVAGRTVDVHITRLRKKLGDYASLISNRAGFGYKFEAP